MKQLGYVVGFIIAAWATGMVLSIVTCVVVNFLMKHGVI